jgi:hypothetical protein
MVAELLQGGREMKATGRSSRCGSLTACERQRRAPSRRNAPYLLLVPLLLSLAGCAVLQHPRSARV